MFLGFTINARKLLILGACTNEINWRVPNLYYDKHSLPIDIRKSILPVYNVLCHPDMLAKCLHGKTQNANESFNGMIWNRVPTNVRVGLPVL